MLAKRTCLLGCVALALEGIVLSKRRRNIDLASLPRRPEISAQSLRKIHLEQGNAVYGNNARLL